MFRKPGNGEIQRLRLGRRRARSRPLIISASSAHEAVDSASGPEHWLGVECVGVAGCGPAVGTGVVIPGGFNAGIPLTRNYYWDSSLQNRNHEKSVDSWPGVVSGPVSRL
jgi:hypothetical protein